MCCLYDEQEEIFTKQIEMKSYQAESLMEMVHLDFPSLWSHTERGNEYILMLVDSFTKWVECVSLLTKTANVTTRAAINILFSQGMGILSRYFRIKSVTLRVSSFTRFVRCG